MSSEVEIEVEAPAAAEIPASSSVAEVPRESGQESESDEDQTLVTIDDQPINQADDSENKAPAAEWVRELRKQHREAQRKLKEQEAELQRLKAPAQVQPTITTKPRLEDFDFDTDKYEAALLKWHEHKKQIDDLEAQAKQTEEQQKRNWAQRLEVYGTSKQSLKLEDYDQAEDVVQQNLNVVQQGIIIQGAENPAAVVYVLGKDPTKAKEFAAIKDPVKFAIAIGKLETKLKVTNRKAPPPPPTTIRGNASISGTVDSHLERLRAEAERTGDYTKVHQYRQQKKDSSRRG